MTLFFRPWLTPSPSGLSFLGKNGSWSWRIRQGSARRLSGRPLLKAAARIQAWHTHVLVSQFRGLSQRSAALYTREGFHRVGEKGLFHRMRKKVARVNHSASRSTRLRTARAPAHVRVCPCPAPILHWQSPIRHGPAAHGPRIFTCVPWPLSGADLAVADSPLSARNNPAGRRRATRPPAGRRRASSVNAGHNVAVLPSPC